MLEIESPEALRRHLEAGGSLAGAVLQGLDLRAEATLLEGQAFAGCTLLGCRLPPEVLRRAHAEGALVFPALPDLPFAPYRGALYTPAELYQGFDPDAPESYQDTLDARVYRHWKQTGGAEPGDILEALAQRLHDHAMTDALEEFLHPAGAPARKVVAVMGGHSMPREVDGPYATVARLARTLTRLGFCLATGGGPGAMEAGHLGAWFAGRDDDELEQALATLAEAPSYTDALWLAQAFRVRQRFPLSDAHRAEFPSLGIPTWLYGHEPPNPFAGWVAKYFANSIREEGLLTIADHGVVFSPGSAGTIQEVFQDACQNHYRTTGFASPMVFLGRDYWTETKPVYPLLEQLAAGHEYADWLSCTDDPAEVVAELQRFAATRG